MSIEASISTEEADVRIVTGQFPNARKSLCTGNILSGEDTPGGSQSVIGSSWKQAADYVISQTGAVAPISDTSHIARMEELIKSIAKHTLDINKIQVEVMHDFHELHSRLEALKKGTR
jgi:hypothetical protein